MGILYGQIYFQDLSSSKPELKLLSTPCSPIIDPHLSPDGTMLAYVRDSELHVLYLMYNESKQLTFGAEGSALVIFIQHYLQSGISFSCDLGRSLTF